MKHAQLKYQVIPQTTRWRGDFGLPSFKQPIGAGLSQLSEDHGEQDNDWHASFDWKNQTVSL